MTITISKKQIIAAIIIIAAIVAIVFGVKSCGKRSYEDNAIEMKTNSLAIAAICDQILNDYQQNWQTAIQDNKAYDDNGESQFCSDFNTALIWRITYYRNKGYFVVLDSVMNVVKNVMVDMEDAPSKYKETQASLTILYNDVNSLLNSTKDPRGSMLTFASKFQDVLNEISSKRSETDLKISIPQDSIDSKVKALQDIITSKEMEMKKKAEKEIQSIIKKHQSEVAAKGYKPLTDGVYYKVLKEGKGPKPNKDSYVRVNYTMKPYEGNVIDSQTSVEMPLHSLIPGFITALTSMPAGSKWDIYIPSTQAYGNKGAGSQIKPNQDIIFEVELISFR